MGDKKLDPSAREYIDTRIKENIEAGDKPKVAVAKSYQQAREVGFNVPDHSNKPSIFSRLFGGKKTQRLNKVA